MQRNINTERHRAEQTTTTCRRSFVSSHRRIRTTAQAGSSASSGQNRLSAVVISNERPQRLRRASPNRQHTRTHRQIDDRSSALSGSIERTTRAHNHTSRNKRLPAGETLEKKAKSKKRAARCARAKPLRSNDCDLYNAEIVFCTYTRRSLSDRRNETTFLLCEIANRTTRQHAQRYAVIELIFTIRVC